jgi:hypothetical protein
MLPNNDISILYTANNVSVTPLAGHKPRPQAPMTNALIRDNPRAGAYWASIVWHCPEANPNIVFLGTHIQMFQIYTCVSNRVNTH